MKAKILAVGHDLPLAAVELWQFPETAHNTAGQLDLGCCPGHETEGESWHLHPQKMRPPQVEEALLRSRFPY